MDEWICILNYLIVNVNKKYFLNLYLGGGGGGSSYVYTAVCRDFVIIHGDKDMPGGLQQNIPDAVGIGEWDKVGGVVGQGGFGDSVKLNAEKNGAIRILKPGFF